MRALKLVLVNVPLGVGSSEEKVEKVPLGVGSSEEKVEKVLNSVCVCFCVCARVCRCCVCVADGDSGMFLCGVWEGVGRGDITDP